MGSPGGLGLDLRALPYGPNETSLPADEFPLLRIPGPKRLDPQQSSSFGLGNADGRSPIAPAEYAPQVGPDHPRPLLPDGSAGFLPWRPYRLDPNSLAGYAPQGGEIGAGLAGIGGSDGTGLDLPTLPYGPHGTSLPIGDGPQTQVGGRSSSTVSPAELDDGPTRPGFGDLHQREAGESVERPGNQGDRAKWKGGAAFGAEYGRSLPGQMGVSSQEERQTLKGIGKGLLVNGPTHFVQGIGGMIRHGPGPGMAIDRAMELGAAAADPDGLLAGLKRIQEQKNAAFTAEINRLLTTPEGFGELLFNAGATLLPGPKFLRGDTEAIRTGPYGTLTEELKGTGLQANHLNQNAAFKEIIPELDGIALGMKGDALRDVGSPHYEFHASLERFWSPYRKGGELFGTKPTNAQYGAALEEALIRGGYTRAQAAQVAERAAAHRAAYGLAPSAQVPRVPNRLPQKKR